MVWAYDRWWREVGERKWRVAGGGAIGGRQEEEEEGVVEEGMVEEGKRRVAGEGGR